MKESLSKIVKRVDFTLIGVVILGSLLGLMFALNVHYF